MDNKWFWYFEFTGHKLDQTEVLHEHVKIDGINADLKLVQFLADNNWDTDSLQFITIGHLNTLH